jgi:peptidoglycan/xylan/chitin deacetylase (PgdA/CDA1 family)
VVGGAIVLMYHGIGAEGDKRDRYRVSEENFIRQMDWLRKNNFEMVDPLDLAKGFDSQRSASGKRKALLTFDDGLISDYERALPVLRERGMRAAFFLTTSLIGQPGYVSRRQARELAEAGMSIGSHGERHASYTRLDPARARRELERSRMELEEITGGAVLGFSAPYGFLNRRLERSAHEAGFRWIFSSLPWAAKDAGRSIPRLAVYGETSLEEFAGLARGEARVLIPRLTRHAALYCPKQILLRLRPGRLGVEVYEEQA